MFSYLTLMLIHSGQHAQQIAHHSARSSIFLIMILYGLLAMAAFAWTVWVGYLLKGIEGLEDAYLDDWFCRWLTMVSVAGIVIAGVLLFERHSYMVTHMLMNSATVSFYHKK